MLADLHLNQRCRQIYRAFTEKLTFTSLLYMRSPFKHTTPQPGASWCCGSVFWQPSYPRLPGRTSSELSLVGPLVCDFLQICWFILGLWLGYSKGSAVLSQSCSIPQFADLQTFSHYQEKSFDALRNSSSPHWFRSDHDVSTTVFYSGDEDFVVICSMRDEVFFSSSIFLFSSVLKTAVECQCGL